MPFTAQVLFTGPPPQIPPPTLANTFRQVQNYEFRRFSEHQPNSLGIRCLKFCLPTFNEFLVHCVSLNRVRPQMTNR